ncbi:glycoside hydrolase family 43 protein [Microbulbifer bruguierae]|uniref:Glycoside hydrolase family 43 protein n=1 Tax=Microbulbifer bruguierae TaxID=3029061 RepID=A0ABY8NJV8_9GAMM|nr:glycoside hydrolase family 43 protein [Microbulbifer bruguierae]WGL18367.1 glycoside hydrolase family 43 protein [Microbulbifer bruguierae]
MKTKTKFELLLGGLVFSCIATAENISTSTATFDWFEYRGDDRVFEQPLAANEYRNPILAGYYPDPSVEQVGGDYYLVNSSFAHFPGIPVFHSRDLVNWTQIGNVIDRPDQVDFSGLGISRGIFAPAISYHNGTFYLVTTCVDCGGNFVVTAENPAGPWSDPVWLPGMGGIDPSLFFDDNGRAYIVNNDAPAEEPRYDGHRAIWVQEFDPQKLTLIGPRQQIVNGGVDIAEKPVWIEGPHLLRRNGQLYLIAAEGGTSVNHSQVVFKADTPFGPFTPWSGNPILTQRHLNPARVNPVTSVGHADFVQDGEGAWWAVFLGTRPYQGDYYNTGRETFLMPVTWDNGWPRITRDDQPVPYVAKRPALPAQAAAATPTTGNFSLREEFDTPQLPLHWLQLRNPSSSSWYSLQQSPGSLTLTPTSIALGDTGNPAFLARRQQHLQASASTRLHYQPQRAGDRAGMAVFQNREHFYFFGVTGSANGKPQLLVSRRDGDNKVQGETIASRALELPVGQPVDIQLRIQARGPEYDFHYRLGTGTDSTEMTWQPLLLAADGRVVSTRRAGGFVGAVIGLYAFTDGH